MSPTVSRISSTACVQIERLCKLWVKKEIESVTEHLVMLEKHFNNAEKNPKKTQGKTRVILTEVVTGQLRHAVCWLYVT